MELEFRGFVGTMAFLDELRAHNDRAWFNAHKADYERAFRAPGEAFAAAVRPDLEALAERPLSVKIFRIHRDVRFSKDKSPYNTHLHVGFMAEPRPGQRHGTGYYMGLDADRLTVGAGTFDLEGATLDRYRAAVADDAEGGALTALLDRLKAAGCTQDEPPLKRVPAPYPADHPRGELLRRKGLTAWRDVGDRARIETPAVLDDILAAFRELQPLNEWVDEALG